MQSGRFVLGNVFRMVVYTRTEAVNKLAFHVRVHARTDRNVMLFGQNRLS